MLDVIHDALLYHITWGK